MQVVEQKYLTLKRAVLGDRINGLNISVSDVSCLYCWNMHGCNANSKPTTPVY